MIYLLKLILSTLYFKILIADTTTFSVLVSPFSFPLILYSLFFFCLSLSLSLGETTTSKLSQNLAAAQTVLCLSLSAVCVSNYTIIGI